MAGGMYSCHICHQRTCTSLSSKNSHLAESHGGNDVVQNGLNASRGRRLYLQELPTPDETPGEALQTRFPYSLIDWQESLLEPLGE
jgi:hypothetical protein